MWLQTVWFVLYVAVIAGYVILDGFDLGVGMLSVFVARDDREQRTLLNSIGPVWDGNEVWLVVAGGALFAAFPLVYAALFSGFYLAMMLVLLVLILRTIAIEFRSKREGRRWRRTWDWFFFASSSGITLLLGVALGNVIRGVALDAGGNMDVSLVDLLNPYSLALGVTAVAMLSLHGGIYLTLKVDGDLLRRVERLVPKLMVVFFVLMTGMVAWTAGLDDEVAGRFRDRAWTLAFPTLALASALGAWRLIRATRYLAAFGASAMMIGLLMATVAAGLYPVMLPSSIDVANDLTIHNASSAEPTLMVMFVFALIGLPFVLLYTAGVYYFFRGRVVLDDGSY
ncbi:MAG: cytochrome d ubiquinol oxidase subunit II [Actinobacteria bacterium]|nr:cytochrome d ubiquinol oxidase subunit II [Actinomycetota bacterium]